jgi:hypothetical protein
MRGLQAYSLLAALALVGCSDAPEQQVESGVYEIVLVVEEPGTLPTAGPGERWFPYAPSAVDDGPPRRFLLRVDGAVPLELARDPVYSEDEEGRKQIALTLTSEAGSALADLTRRLVGRRAAVVIGGEVISFHKVRQPILGNVVVISC